MKKIFLFTPILMLITILSANSWTNWRGPNHNGTIEVDDWNPEALLDDPEILWEASVGKGHSQCAVLEGNLYTSGTTIAIAGTDTTAEDKIYCLDAETGDEIWSYSYPSENISFPGIRTSPVIDEGKLFTLSSKGDLYSFDAMSGNVVWKKNLTTDFNVIRPSWGFSGSPVIYNDMIILSAGENGIAINKKNGRLIWASDLEIIGCLNSPYLLEYNGKTYAIISDEKNVHCVDLETGEKKWSYKYSTQNDPIFHDGKLFLSGDYRAGSVMLELTDGEPKELWKDRGMRGGFQNKVIVGNYAYGFAAVRNDNQLHCISLTDGKLQWTQDLDASYGALMAINNKLVVVNGQGKVIIAEADSSGLKSISAADVIPMADNTGLSNDRQCQCWIDPIMVDGKIYVKNNFGNLVCINVE